MPYALCVTGNALYFITNESERSSSKDTLISQLVHLAMKVSSVIFCRVFPKQKVSIIL